MLIGENILLALSGLLANKMRALLTMLGIIIGIGSVISIVSIGDTMRGMFSSLYQDIGITQAYLGIGYWIDDTRQSDYFTMDELSRIKSVFGDKIKDTYAEVEYYHDQDENGTLREYYLVSRYEKNNYDNSKYLLRPSIIVVINKKNGEIVAIRPQEG